MRAGLGFAVAVAAVCAGAAIAAAQAKVEKTPNPAHLELTAEVAATTDEGYPSVLRITLKNVGNVAVDMPMPKLGCVLRGGGIEVHLSWTPSDQGSGSGMGRGWGVACGQTDMPKLLNRVRNEWILLRPGESVVESEDLRGRLGKLDPGTVEYWVEYSPPEANARELGELQEAGFVVPTEKIETEHWTFAVH